MKAGIYLALSALATVARPGDTRLPVDFLVVPDEETGSHASRAHIERHAANAKYALVCEPARANGGKCVTARKGTGMLNLNVKGRPAHAGMNHDKGRSAIREMAHQVLALEAMTDYERGITVSVGTIAGGTVTNTVPAHCRCVVDFRVPDMGAAEDAAPHARAVRRGSGRGAGHRRRAEPPAHGQDRGRRRLLALVQGYAERAGFLLEDAPMTGGGSDANFTSAMGVPTLDGLGADGDGAHTLHEYILVSTLEQRLKFWELLLKELSRRPRSATRFPWALPSSGHAGGPAEPDPRHRA